MKLKPLFVCLSFGAAVIALSACDSSGGEAPNAGAALPAQTASAAGTPYLGITDEELGWRAEVPTTETGSLQVQNDFNFDTARGNVVSMSVPEAVGTTAEATFCTDYTYDGVSYDVDYDSCILQATVTDGYVYEEITLPNQHTKVLGMVWLEDPAAAPVYKEFDFN